MSLGIQLVQSSVGHVTNSVKMAGAAVGTVVGCRGSMVDKMSALSACISKLERGLLTDANVGLAGCGRSLRGLLPPSDSIGSRTRCSTPSCSLVAFSVSFLDYLEWRTSGHCAATTPRLFHLWTFLSHTQ